MIEVVWQEAPLLMDSAPNSCRAYIVYHDGLFAQGMRSLLEWGQAAEVVGMETDVERALTAVSDLKPEVLIVEESAGGGRPISLSRFLDQGVAPRIVTLSMGHDFATVYEHSESRQLPVRCPVEFAAAIRGSEVSRLPA